MRWEERRTGQTKFFWHNKMPWEVNFGGLEAEADTNRKTQIRVSASVLATTYRRETTFYVLPQVECADSGKTIIVSHPNPFFFFRENILSRAPSFYYSFPSLAGKPLWLPAFFCGFLNRHYNLTEEM